MTNHDPKDDSPKPEQTPEQKQAASADKGESKISLGDVAPVGKDTLQQFKSPPPEASGSVLNFGPKGDDFGRAMSNFKTEASLAEIRNQMERAQQSQRNEQNKDFRWSQSMNAGLPFAEGGRQFFRYLKGEEVKLCTEAKPLPELKGLTEKFLTETEPGTGGKLSSAEEADLQRSRQQLRDATNPADILSNALHLARLYQHLRYIEEAKEALYLSMGIDPDHPQVRQLFSELERMHPVDVGITSQAIAQASLTKSGLRRAIQNLSGGRVIVAGDLLIDELLEGKPERISREAPVLILEHVETVLIPGGAANTAHNISTMGGICHAVGICGTDDYARKLAVLLEKCGITHSLVQDPTRPTTVKTRILSKSHSQMQQLLRMDRISHEPISKEMEFALKQRLEQCASSYKAIVLSDYKAGVITDGIIETCRLLASQHNLMVVVDAQQRFERFKGVTLMTPNQPDTEKAVGYKLDTREALQKAGSEILKSTGAKSLLITRGADGMVLFEPNRDMVELPAFNRSDVFDVTGAGDTVVGTMTLALVTGASYLEAMALGNLAAGIVVRKSGTAVTSQKEMLENLELLKLPE